MQFFAIFKIFLLCVILSVVGSEIDYCSSELCSGLQHVACNNDGEFNENCPSDRKILDLSEADIQLILNEHNKFRNKIASGEEIGFKTASKMTTMIWNTELAKLAELNAKTCQFGHDTCRNTKQFHYAGQNIALSQVSDKFDILNDVIKNSIQSWYMEVTDATQQDVDKYQTTPERKIGHFTQMVNELSNEIGCAAVQFTEQGWKTSIFVCDYARTNILDLPIYVSGDIASRCTSGVNKDFTGLCSVDELVDPNSE